MSIFSLVIALFAIIFWILRIAVAFTASMGIEFIMEPINLTAEIVLTFITFISIILIFKRSIIGALIYLLSNIGYFGYSLYNIFVNNPQTVDVNSLNIMVSTCGVILPLIIFIDVGFSKSSKKTSNKTKKTDWYYQNDEYDRQYDERADRNQYKF